MHKEYKAKTRRVFSLKVSRGLLASELDFYLPD